MGNKMLFVKFKSNFNNIKISSLIPCYFLVLQFTLYHFFHLIGFITSVMVNVEVLITMFHLCAIFLLPQLQTLSLFIM